MSRADLMLLLNCWAVVGGGFAVVRAIESAF